MRPEPNKDIDLLLRQLSRRNGVPVSEADEQHLDADELNSYVANALPAPARARYTEHMADCSTCRKLVAQLSAAQGPVAVQQTACVVAPSGLKSFLASLFSPMVLRYAVPALGLIVIAAVGIFVYRPQPAGSNVAQVGETETKPAPVLEAQPAAASPSVANEAESGVSAREAPQSGPVAAPVTKEAQGRGAAQPVGADDASTAAAAPPAPKVAAIQSESAPPPAASVESEVAKKEKAAEQDKATNIKPASEPARRDYARDQSTSVVTVAPGTTTRQDVEVRAAQRSATPMGAGTGSLKRPAKAKDSATAEDKADESAAETRSVAGRRFRKSGGIWIDTDYDASKPITSVARNSEQFRALVADEPAIKTIVDQLDGQIVVVWKGRTYRIR